MKDVSRLMGAVDRLAAAVDDIQREHGRLRHSLDSFRSSMHQAETAVLSMERNLVATELALGDAHAQVEAARKAA